MSLEQDIMADLKIAMCSKDRKAFRISRAVKTAIITAKASKIAGSKIDFQEAIKIL